MNTTISAVSSSVPTISVTPHSPAGISITPVNKQYSVLEENLKQLHDIVEAVQHMKDANVGALSVNTQILKISEQCIRLSCSCPSLNEFSSDAEGVGNSITSSPSHIDLSTSMRESGEWKSSSGRITSSLNSGMSSGEILRRRSWAALEDLSAQRELDRKIGKQRSVSLSSLESDIEDIFLDTDGYSNLTTAPSAGTNAKPKAVSNSRAVRHCSTGGVTPSNISTHSLNEADLMNDFNKIRLKREEVRLLQARLPLQKSISTPSILAFATRDLSSSSYNEQGTTAVDAGASNNTFTLSSQRPSGTESETEEEMVSLLDDHRLRHFPFDEMVQMNVSLDAFLQESSTADGISVGSAFTYDDRPEKRRKRGSSLFFRKKKEKVKKINGTHLWVSVTQGNLSNIVLCDWCSKPVETKHARQCGSCFITVHQGLCVQHISATECHHKPKATTKVSGKIGTQQQTQNKTINKKSGNITSVVSSSQGNSPIINEEKEDVYFIKNQQAYEDHVINYSEEVPLVTQEFLNEEQIGAGDLDTDPYLGLQDEEPDTWTPTVNKEILKKLKEKEIKRQEHIYEFVLTEKHHCLTLILMQKIFVDGLKKHFQLGPNLHRMFPRLSELTEIHLKFLRNLRKKQKEASVVDSISDILLEQFSGSAATQLKTAYGEFCSRHRDAVDIYKYYLSENAAFAAFVKHCQNNPLLKKKGIPECILFVTQRLTKYPLLIEPLIKTSKENKSEVDKLTRALALVRSILTEVDSRVAEKEKEDRKLEIYHKIDAKSFTMYRNSKFKKSDILSNNRKLRFEGLASLMQGRTKPQTVYVIVLSDILLFLAENNNKFSFFTPDCKAGVVSLQKLLVREKAGGDARSIYLISSNPSDPEMFELKIQKPKDKATWINSIREAVQNCPEDDHFLDDNGLTQEEKQKRVHISQVHMHQIVGILRQKDVEQALIYEEKIALLLKLLAAAGVDIGMEPPSYCHLVSEYLDNDTIRKEVFNTIQKVNQLTSSLYISGTNLSRSASSVGERQSNTYVSPLLPKRAETFGGFDNAISCKGFVAGVGRKLSQQFQKKSSGEMGQDLKSHSPSLPSSPVSTPELITRKLQESTKNISPPIVNIIVPPAPLLQSNGSCQKLDVSQQELPTLLQLEIEQQSTVVQLTSHIYTLALIIAQQMSSIDSLEAQLAFCRQELSQSSNEKERKSVYNPNQQLEELRNLQDKLTQEKEQWQREKEMQQKELQEEREQLLKLHEQIRIEREDIALQREQLYRKLEAVSSQGLVNAANPPLLTSPQLTSPQQPNTSTSPSSLLLDLSSPTSSLPGNISSSPSESWKRRNDSVRWKQSPAQPTNVLPLNLISATNQQKVASSNVQVKQKLPLKLATKLGNTPATGSSSTSNSCTGTTNTSSTPSATSTSSLSTTSSLCSPPSSHSSNSNKSQHQILPWKLRESNSGTTNVLTVGTAELRRSCTTANSSTTGYERLVSTETVGSTSLLSSHSHSRTGSSPAMMQNIRVSPPASHGENKDGRTNTYPKVPEKYRISGSSNEPALKNSKNMNEEDKVIFF